MSREPPRLRSLVDLEHAFQVPAFRLRSGRVLEHRRPGGDTRRVAGREVFLGILRQDKPGGLRPPRTPPLFFFGGIFDIFFGLRSDCVLCVLGGLLSQNTAF